MFKTCCFGRISLVFLLLTPVTTKVISRNVNPTPILFRNNDSPLDEEFAHYYDDVVPNTAKESGGSASDPKQALNMPTAADLAKLPACQQKCTGYLNEAFQVIVKASNHYDRYFGVCENYDKTLNCMDLDTGCATRELFDTMTSGFKYMCVDQKHAFRAMIECIDGSAHLVVAECNQKCNTQGKMNSWALQSGILEGFQNKEKLLNPMLMKSMMRDGCELADCHLGCMKAKFNERCEGHAGNLISEMFVRPIAKTHESEMFRTMGNVLGMFLPEQCSFMINSQDLSRHRIDPTADKSLRTRYDKAEDTLDTHDGQQLNSEPAIAPEIDLGVPASPLDAPDTVRGGENNGLEVTVQHLNETAVDGMTDYDFEDPAVLDEIQKANLAQTEYESLNPIE